MASASSSVGAHDTWTCSADRLALAAALAEGREHALELLARLIDGDQSVGPAAAPARRLGADRGADQRRRLGGQRPQARAVDSDEAVVVDLLAGEQRAHDLHALAQARVALGLGRPALAGHVLVGRLARAQRDPQPPGEHLAERRDRLGDDRRVVALPGRVDHAEGQVGVASSAAPRNDHAKPDSPWRSLQGEKWSEDIAAAKPAASASRTCREHAARGDLLVRAVQADRTGSPPGSTRCARFVSRPAPRGRRRGRRRARRCPGRRSSTSSPPSPRRSSAPSPP